MLSVIKLTKFQRWRILNPHAYLNNQLKWYYKKRKLIIMMNSKPKGIEDDAADVWLAELEARRTR